MSQPALNIPAHLKVNIRRTVAMGLGLGVVALVALVLTGHPLLGVFGCLGILLGCGNALLVRRSVTAYGSAPTMDEAQRKLLTMSIAGPLLVTTVLAIVIGIVFAPNGVAVFGGLLVFQMLMMAGAALPMMREGRDRPQP
jgi:hypothetical protein